ncbi:MAG: fatty acid desaturase [Bacteroidia bacterium]|nr:fatty acid desaturase [Bacteroidia bacterium]
MIAKRILYKPVDPLGVIIGSTLIIAWFVSLFYLLNMELSYNNPLIYFAIYIQTHLYTGLFITSHDAMHGSVSKDKKVNAIIGRITALLFAFNSYDHLIVKHHEHHKHVASHHDPDYHESGKFWLWYWSFIKRYITIRQLILMTISLQVLNLIFPLENLILYWILPSILSTFQLFYFGTYIPHKDGHESDNKHKSSTLEKNHLWAFLSCYFFGYHYEHHDVPGVPWWRLWKVK